MENLAAEIAADHGRLHALVINDSIHKERPLVEVSIGDWNEMLGKGVTAAFHCAKHLGPLMFPSRYGKIVITTGPESTSGFAGRAHMCASRHAMVGLVKDLAIEMAEHRVNVNIAAPDHAVDTDASPEAIAALTHSVLRLACDASRFVTGSVVRAAPEPTAEAG